MKNNLSFTYERRCSCCCCIKYNPKKLNKKKITQKQTKNGKFSNNAKKMKIGRDNRNVYEIGGKELIQFLVHFLEYYVVCCAINLKYSVFL